MNTVAMLKTHLHLLMRLLRFMKNGRGKLQFKCMGFPPLSGACQTRQTQCESRTLTACLSFRQSRIFFLRLAVYLCTTRGEKPQCLALTACVDTEAQCLWLCRTAFAFARIFFTHSTARQRIYIYWLTVFAFSKASHLVKKYWKIASTFLHYCTLCGRIIIASQICTRVFGVNHRSRNSLVALYPFPSIAAPSSFQNYGSIAILLGHIIIVQLNITVWHIHKAVFFCFWLGLGRDGSREYWDLDFSSLSHCSATYRSAVSRIKCAQAENQQCADISGGYHCLPSHLHIRDWIKPNATVEIWILLQVNCWMHECCRAFAFMKSQPTWALFSYVTSCAKLSSN